MVQQLPQLPRLLHAALSAADSARAAESERLVAERRALRRSRGRWRLLAVVSLLTALALAAHHLWTHWPL